MKRLRKRKVGWCMGTNLKLFFWQNEFPVRSFHRIFILLSLVTYIAGRLIDPGPIWIRSLIESLVYKFNLDLIHAIPYVNSSVNHSLWSGGGLALQLQLLLIYPISCIFAIWSSCLAKYGSAESHKLYQDLNFPHNWWNQLIQPNFLLLIALGLFYLPFLGEKITSYKPSGVASRALHDDLVASIFFYYSWLFNNLYIYSIHSCIKKRFKKFI